MEIKNAKYVISNTRADKCPDTSVPEYAFIGRSNVGKSSLINMLANNKNLAKTSQLPGKTLLINHFSVNNGDWYIVDLPGYGYAQRGKAQREEIKSIITDYILHRTQMTCLFVLLDIRHEPQKIDLEFLSWLGENQVPFCIVFTKADKISADKAARMVEDYRKTLSETWEELPPVFVTSSEKKLGREQLLDYIGEINTMITSEEAKSASPEHTAALESGRMAVNDAAQDIIADNP
ncbi:MAG: ribosome biogenesis GTP-binding protein YihA/YsxC [Muribaculaceae bacterium]|nr:ribosome biogenesis GTP-binding protein YihA/YsxC [Muribaculaceae bacterium]